MGQSGLILPAVSGHASDPLYFGSGQNWRDLLKATPQWSIPLQNAVRTMLATPGPGFVIWGDEHRLLCNEAYLALFNSGAAPLPGASFRFGQDPGPDAAALARAYGGQTVLLPEVTLATAPGVAPRYVTVALAPIMAADGAVLGVLGSCLECTARSLREQRMALLLDLAQLLTFDPPDVALQAVAPRLGTLLGAGRIGLGRMLEDGRQVEINQDWTLGSMPSLAGRQDLASFGDHLRTAPDGFVLAVHDTGSDVPGLPRAALTVALGSTEDLRTILFLHTEAPRNWSGGDVALAQDVGRQLRNAEERQAEEAALRTRMAHRTAELERTEDALRQAQKMEAIGQLTGGIAHDFNNLLQGISGSLDLIQTRIAQGRLAAVGPFLKSASASASRATALTHRLLAFARRQPIDPRPVQPNELIASLRSLLRRSCGEAIRLELALEDGLWNTLCDSNQLENALLNLAINARDAMPDGGTLTIATSSTRHEGGIPSLRDLEPGDYVCIRVSDSGCGMPPEVVERAFEPFFTTKPLGQGTGLGLSMIYGFTRQSKGTVRILSRPDEGTMVELYLPRHDRMPMEPPAPSSLSEPPPASGGEVVLVVEDDPVVRQLVVEVLSEHGYAVLQAEDGHSGQRLIEKLSRIDLLVTDIGLPGPDGRQLAEMLRQRQPDVRVLFMTGYAEAAARGEGFLAPGMEMVVKPFAMDDLTIRVHALLENL